MMLVIHRRVSPPNLANTSPPKLATSTTRTPTNINSNPISKTVMAAITAVLSDTQGRITKVKSACHSRDSLRRGKEEIGMSSPPQIKMSACLPSTTARDTRSLAASAGHSRQTRTRARRTMPHLLHTLFTMAIGGKGW